MYNILIDLLLVSLTLLTGWSNLWSGRSFGWGVSHLLLGLAMVGLLVVDLQGGM
jgi:hypothetical protein